MAGRGSSMESKFVEGWYFHMTQVFLVSVPINSAYGPPTFSPLEISHITVIP